MASIDELNHEAACYLSQANQALDEAHRTLRRAALEKLRPFYLIKPKYFRDGNMHGFLYGEDLQNGICAFGKTANEASRNFDIAWLNETISAKQLEAI